MVDVAVWYSHCCGRTSGFHLDGCEDIPCLFPFVTFCAFACFTETLLHFYFTFMTSLRCQTYSAPELIKASLIRPAPANP
jgi:hypothetical protein